MKSYPILKYKKAWSFPERTEKFIKSKSSGKILHVCCGSSKFGDVRIDIEPQDKGVIKADIFHLPIKEQSFDTVICDPPWHIPYHLRTKIHYELRDACKMGGIIIFNAPWVPNIKHCRLLDIFVGLRSFTMANISLITIYQKYQEQLFL